MKKNLFVFIIIFLFAYAFSTENIKKIELNASLVGYYYDVYLYGKTEVF